MEVKRKKIFVEVPADFRVCVHFEFRLLRHNVADGSEAIITK